jgi:hypothetical protein
MCYGNVANVAVDPRHKIWSKWLLDNICLVGTLQQQMMDFLKPFKDDGSENDWEMSKEGSIHHDFLGIKITLGSSNRTWMMTQEDLTSNILAATDTTDCNDAKETTTSPNEKAFGTNKNGMLASTRIQSVPQTGPSENLPLSERYSYDSRIEIETFIVRIGRLLCGC